MLLPNGRLELTQGAARHASRAAGARPEEIRNQSFACALALAGSGGFREARRFIAYLRLDGTGSGDAHGRRYRLFDDNRFFPVPVAAGACCCNGCQSHDCESDKKLIYGWCSCPNM
jgi:hypothetical protein